MLKSFRKGGIHPHEHKLTAGKPIITLPLPSEVVLPIAQHIGKPAALVVKKGDTVKVGTIIAKSTGYVSANVHSSVSGTVVKTEELTDITGYKRMSVVIRVEGDEWEESIRKEADPEELKNLRPEEIRNRIAAAGIVGLGGAAFPTHVKMEIPAGMHADLLLINGVECEPYLTADHRLMIEEAEKMIEGIRLMMRSIQVKKAIIGIENNKKDAITHLRSLLAGDPDIKVEALAVKYPQGSEKQLIEALTGRRVKAGKLPISVGVVVNNAGTAVATYEAVALHKPLIERIVTVTGKEVAAPGNFRVRIGTPVMHLIEAAGGIPADTGKIIVGGPMMGKAICSLEIGVTKGTSGILMMPGKESVRPAASPCIRCGKCVTACPMNLEPYLLMTLSEKSLISRLDGNHISDCVECGSCVYICPAARPLLDHIRMGKIRAAKLARSRHN